MKKTKLVFHFLNDIFLTELKEFTDLYRPFYFSGSRRTYLQGVEFDLLPHVNEHDMLIIVEYVTRRWGARGISHFQVVVE